MPRQLLKRWQSTAQAAWQQRAPRERRALGWLGGVLIIALAGQLLWSLESARRNQQRLLPRLAADAERMAALAADWRALAADLAAAGEQPHNTARQRIDRRLPELGPDINAQWRDGDELQLHGKVDFATWLRWTAAMQQEYRLVLSRSRCVASAGGVDLEASYRLAPATL